MFVALEGLSIESRQERGSVRRACRAPCQVVTEEGFALVSEETIDISTDGILVRSEKVVRVGEPVILSLRTPRGTSWIDAEGRVARVVEGRREGDLSRAVGVRFDRMDPVDRAILAGSLRGLPPPLPARAPRRDYASVIGRLLNPGAHVEPLRHDYAADVIDYRTP